MFRRFAAAFFLVWATLANACGGSTTAPPTNTTPPVVKPAEQPVFSRIVVSQTSLSLQIGGTAPITVTAWYKIGGVETSSVDVTTATSWSISAPEVVSVNNGTFRAMSPGSAQATASYGGGNAVLNVAVVAPVQVIDPRVLPALAFADQLDATAEDGLTYVGRVSDVVKARNVSIIYTDSAAGKYDIPSNTVRLDTMQRRVSVQDQAAYLVGHELAHAFGKNYASHTCPCSYLDDKEWGDGGAWTFFALFARAMIVRGIGNVDDWRANIRAAATHIQNQNSLPDWVRNPNLVVKK